MPGVVEPTCPEEVPGPFHPLVQVHPVTGKKLFILAAVVVGHRNISKETLMIAENYWIVSGPTPPNLNMLESISGVWVIC